MNALGLRLVSLSAGLLAAVSAQAAIIVANGDFASEVTNLQNATIDQTAVGAWYGNSFQGNMVVDSGVLKMKTGANAQDRYVVQIIKDDKASTGTFQLQFDLGAVDGNSSTSDTVLFEYEIFGTNDASFTARAQASAGQYNLVLEPPTGTTTTSLLAGNTSFNATTAATPFTSAPFTVNAGSEWNYYIVRFGVGAASSITNFEFGQSSSGYVALDNVAISVPEPAIGVIGLSALALVARRRRA